MSTDTLETKQPAHKLIDRLDANQIDAVVRLLQVMVPTEDEDELTEDDRHAIAASREYFRQGGEGISFEQLATECGLTMDLIRKP